MASVSLMTLKDKYTEKRKGNQREREINSPQHHQIAGGRSEMKLYTVPESKNWGFSVTVNTVA